MFIYLDKSIVDKLSEPVPANIQDSIQGLAFMLRTGVHLVSGDLVALIKISHLTEISDSARSAFSRAAARQTQINTIISKLNTYCLITSEGEHVTVSETNNQRIITIPIALVSNLVSQIATDVIYEDINDAEIYNKVTKWYCKDIVGSSNLPLKSQSIQGGGSRTYATYSEKQNDAKTFCLCITDSDKKYPTDTPGETSKKVREVENLSLPLSFHLDLDFHEIENLIPLSILNSVARTPESKRIISLLKNAEENGFGEAKLYWDYKKGLRAHYSKIDGNYKNYWNSAIGIGDIECGEACTAKHCSCFLLDPWPLKQDLNALISEQKEISPAECCKLTAIWEKIGGTLLSWTIGSPPQAFL
ncbi:hypothetical protein ACP3VQ_23915 [Metapseudomonas otitidis]|uniref:hypothetical protein n=1 Tax=Metapseudomonas otitidis TaxID=319939 RepID=UPI003CF86886